MKKILNILSLLFIAALATSCLYGKGFGEEAEVENTSGFKAEVSANVIIANGEDIAIFDCDFGRVGALICFDLNFEELRLAYRRAKPDMVLFCSMFGGGLMRNFFAYDTQSYFVAACANSSPSEIISPLGESLGHNSNYYNYYIKDINLDYVVCHLDFNWEKLRAAKDKYGAKVQMHDPGYVGVVMLTYEGDDQTILDVIREFDIELADDYFARSREHRARHIEQP